MCPAIWKGLVKGRLVFSTKFKFWTSEFDLGLNTHSEEYHSLWNFSYNRPSIGTTEMKMEPLQLFAITFNAPDMSSPVWVPSLFLIIPLSPKSSEERTLQRPTLPPSNIHSVISFCSNQWQLYPDSNLNFFEITFVKNKTCPDPWAAFGAPVA